MHTKHFDLGRFSDPSLLILASLASGPKHGYAMMEDIAAFCGTQLEPGTLYAARVQAWRPQEKNHARTRAATSTHAGTGLVGRCPASPGGRTLII
jgi:hypothetical protein